MPPMLKTASLLAAMATLGALAGALADGPRGAALGAPAGLAIGLLARGASSRLLLRAYGAQQVDESSAPYLVKLVQELAQRAAVPTPQVWLFDDPAPAALATGARGRRCAVALSTGLLSLLSERELRAVIGHELAHIRHGDVRAAALGSVLSGALVALALLALGASVLDGEDDGPAPSGWALWLLAPLAALPLWLAAGREREFDADRLGARIAGDPGALADALYKIEHAAAPRPALRHPHAAALLVVAPVGAQGWRRRLVRHPPTAERIARLRQSIVARD